MSDKVDDAELVKKENNIIVNKLLELFKPVIDTDGQDEFKVIIEDSLFPYGGDREIKMVEYYKEILELVKNLKVTCDNFKVIIELHDNIKFIQPRVDCTGINIFRYLIDAIIYYIEKVLPMEVTLTKGESYTKSEKKCKQNIKKLDPTHNDFLWEGGHKSRRRHRHRRKPARKTRRGRGRIRKSKSKSKSKPKTHRRRRHSRIRKHKKNTYKRLR